LEILLLRNKEVQELRLKEKIGATILAIIIKG
jgi:hypothetical protein